mmetsp:Transcript_32198/g.77865  ORF Transcript_32198/g.77865 Transcript_32198/m.77865 type:complete len:292 (-) Transcript_32198:1794-2669(-)
MHARSVLPSCCALPSCLVGSVAMTPRRPGPSRHERYVIFVVVVEPSCPANAENATQCEPNGESESHVNRTSSISASIDRGVSYDIDRIMTRSCVATAMLLARRCHEPSAVVAAVVSQGGNSTTARISSPDRNQSRSPSPTPSTNVSRSDDTAPRASAASSSALTSLCSDSNKHGRPLVVSYPAIEISGGRSSPQPSNANTLRPTMPSKEHFRALSTTRTSSSSSFSIVKLLEEDITVVTERDVPSVSSTRSDEQRKFSSGLKGRNAASRPRSRRKDAEPRLCMPSAMSKMA